MYLFFIISIQLILVLTFFYLTRKSMNLHKKRKSKKTKVCIKVLGFKLKVLLSN